MAERRSARKRERTFALPETTRLGLVDLVTGNETVVSEMLGERCGKTAEELVALLAGVAGQQELNAEGLLGRFFSSEMLSDYAVKVGKSGKGTSATLASRISSHWLRKGPEAATASAPKKAASAVASAASPNAAVETSITPDATRRIVINTSNDNKFKEFSRMFEKASNGTIELERRSVDLPEIEGTPVEVVANKAAAAGEGVLIEDTSLDVDGKEVGVNVKWLLENLDEMAGSKCTWRVLMGVMEGDVVRVYRGEVPGTIVAARGAGGFGFDPVVQPEGSDKTLAEAKPDENSARYRALLNLIANKVDVETPPIREWSGKWQA